MINDLLIRLRALFRRHQVEKDLDDELQFHFDHQVEEFIRRGVPQSEAVQQARQLFGGVDQAKEECRDARGTRPIEESVRDLNFACRMLWKSPGFTAIALSTIAIGIGANAAIFTVVNRAIFEPVSLPAADRVVSVSVGNERNVERSPYASASQFAAWRDTATAFEIVTAASGISGQISGPGEPEEIRGLQVTESFCELAGMRSLRGRLLAPPDFQPGSHKVTLVSAELSRRHFPSHDASVGKPLRIDGEVYQIVGVIGHSSPFPADGIQFWTPLRFSPSQLTIRGRRNLEVFGRLRPQVSAVESEAQLNDINQRLEANYPDWLKGRRVQVTPIAAGFLAKHRETLIVISGLAGFILLICCANVANLLLARCMRRGHEIAVRMSLGASRWRLVRQLLTESVCLAAVGGVVGIGVGWWLLRVAAGVLADSPFRTLVVFPHQIVSTPMIMWAFALTLVTAIFFGLAPALETTRPSFIAGLREDSRTSSPSRGRSSLSGLLIAVELGLSFVLLTGAGLLVRSFSALVRLDRGYAVENLLTARLPPPTPRPTVASRRAFFRDLEQRLRVVPGILEVGFVTGLPLGGLNASVTLPPAAGQALDPETLRWASVNVVNVGYMRAMGIRLVKGALV